MRRALALLLLLLLAACGGEAAPTATPVVIVVTAPSVQEAPATYTPYPTYTAYPTYTLPPAPTQPPTVPPSPPAPTATEPTIQVVQVVTYTTSSYDEVLGVVQNTGNVPIESIKVVVSWNDPSGATVATGSDRLLGSVILPPGSMGPFDVVFTPKAPSGAKLVVQTQAEVYDPQALFQIYPPAEGLVVEGKSLTPDADYFVITGRAANHGTVPAHGVEVIAWAYDVRGKILDAGFDETELNPIPPGDTGPFRIPLSGRGGKIAKYETLVIGYQK